MKNIFKKIEKGLKTVGKGILKIGKGILIILAFVASVVFNPKNASSQGGRSSPYAGGPGRNGPQPVEGPVVTNPSDEVVDEEQESDDEISNPSSQEATENDQDSIEKSSENNEVDLPVDESSDSVFSPNEWLANQKAKDPNYSPLGLKGVYEEQNKPSTSGYSLGANYRLSPQRNASDPKSFNPNIPEKLQNTPLRPTNSDSEDLERNINLDSFSRSHQTTPITPKDIFEIQEKIGSKVSYYDTSENDGNRYVVIGYTDIRGNSHLYVSEIDSKGNVNATQIDVNNTSNRDSDISGQQIVERAEQRVKDYTNRGVEYYDTPPGEKYPESNDASKGGTISDCSHFVKDVLSRAGLKTPYTTTAGIEKSPNFYQVPPEQARSGDIIVQSGHMGIYTGNTYTGNIKSKGSPEGIQMGKHGAKAAPWGPKGWYTNKEKEPKYYRPKP